MRCFVVPDQADPRVILGGESWNWNWIVNDRRKIVGQDHHHAEACDANHKGATKGGGVRFPFPPPYFDILVEQGNDLFKELHITQ